MAEWSGACQSLLWFMTKKYTRGIPAGALYFVSGQPWGEQVNPVRLVSLMLGTSVTEIRDSTKSHILLSSELSEYYHLLSDKWVAWTGKPYASLRQSIVHLPWKWVQRFQGKTMLRLVRFSFSKKLFRGWQIFSSFTRLTSLLYEAFRKTCPFWFSYEDHVALPWGSSFSHSIC